MELEDERFIPEGELNDVGTAAFLADAERGFRFRIKSGESRRHNLLARLLKRLWGLREVNAFQ